MKKITMSSIYCLLTSLLFLTSLSCTRLRKLNPTRHCIEERAAIKIELKKVVYIKAKLNSCDDKLLKISAVEERTFNFSAALENKYASANFKLSKELKSFIQSKINLSKSNGIPLKFAASSQFSFSEFSKLIPKGIGQLFGREVTIFSQRQEAKEYHLAFLASLESTGENQGIWYLDDQKNIIVLPDGSSRITYYSPLTPNSLRKKIISWKGSKGTSPYPIGAFNARRATQLATATALESVPPQLKDALATMKIKGISPIHQLILQPRNSGPRPYSRYQLEQLAKSRISRSSKVEYQENDIAALLLILGYMRGLNINTVKPLDLESRAGILFHSALW